MGKLWDLLVGKRDAGCSELATEIVKLQNELVRIEVDAAEAEKKCLELRQRRLGGENISASRLDKADAACKNSEMDLDAGRQGIEALAGKLHAAAEGELASETQRVLDAAHAKRAKQMKGRLELARAFARFLVGWMENEGGRYDSALEYVPTFHRGEPTHDAFRDEISRLAKGKGVFTISLGDEWRALGVQHEKLKRMAPADFADNILSEARAAANRKGASEAGEEAAA